MYCDTPALMLCMTRDIPCMWWLDVLSTPHFPVEPNPPVPLSEEGSSYIQEVGQIRKNLM